MEKTIGSKEEIYKTHKQNVPKTETEKMYECKTNRYWFFKDIYSITNSGS